jgi:tRNA(Ile2) C34 agmatinyltransferase TiaS
MAKEVYDRIGKIDGITEDATKYMIENGMEPTAENLYKAAFSVKTGNSRQGRGYFANDMHGYYSQKAEVFNWANLQPQMEKVIESAGYEVTDETLMDSMWIIKNGIPFTVDSFDIYEKIKNIDFSEKENNIFDAIATAVADGKPAKEAVLSNTQSMMEKAVFMQEMLSEVTNQAVDMCIDNAQPLNIRNLSYWQKQIDANVITATGAQNNNIQFANAEVKANAYLTLEEARLQMSVEANYRLLKAGYQIEVADLADLVEQLKTDLN